MCGPVVICGACENNACNGGYGKVNGETCKQCPSAYEMMFTYDKDVFNGIKFYRTKSSRKKMMDNMFK